jgi:serine/threonine-protein kinase
VLLSRRGEVKLSDFGIARWKHRTERTLAGASRGKPSYMAPEQATKGDVDARADVFSLGCTLHALCAGSSPLADENALVDLLAGMPLALAPGLPEPIRAIVARAVERDRQARFATAEAFAAACEAALQDQAPGFAVEASIASAVAAVSPVASRGAPPAVEALHAGTLEVHVEPPIAPEPPTPLAEALPRRRVWPGIAAVSFLIVGLFALGVAVSQPPPAVPADDDLAFEPLEADRRAVVTRPVSVASSEPAAAPSVRQPVGAPAPRAPPRLGVIAVGGQRFLRGEVFVDGKSVGFAPRQLEVPVGLHPVEVHLPDGQRVGPRVMSVGAQHTEVAPLRWIED